MFTRMLMVLAHSLLYCIQRWGNVSVFVILTGVMLACHIRCLTRWRLRVRCLTCSHSVCMLARSPSYCIRHWGNVSVRHTRWRGAHVACPPSDPCACWPVHCCIRRRRCVRHIHWCCAGGCVACSLFDSLTFVLARHTAWISWLELI